MTDENDVLVEVLGAVKYIRINRPQSRNGLRPSTCVRLAEEIEQGSANEDVRCIVLGSTEQAFCSGADLGSALQDAQGRSPDDLIRNNFHRLIRSITESHTPTIASIRGAAVGFGFDMALACDLRIASRMSKMGAVFTRIGLVPDGGSSFTLSRLVGLARAMELVLLAETFDGERAADIGIVNKVVDDNSLESATQEWAERLVLGPPIAYRLAKRNILNGCESTLEEALENEIEAQVQCLSSSDVSEGVSAFLQKRKPAFKGK